MSIEVSDLGALNLRVLPPAETEALTETIGTNKVNMPVVRSVILGIFAGIFIALGGMMLSLVNTAGSTLPFPVRAIFGGSMFAIGLVLVLLAGAELFTGNLLALQATLSKKVKWGGYLKNLIIIWIANLLGSLIAVAIAYYSHIWALNAGGAEGTVSWGTAIATIASSKVNQSWDIIFWKGVLCNLLVCLAVWMSFAGKTFADKFLACLFPVTAFVALGTEHVVANMFLIPMGYVMKLEGAVPTDAIKGIDNLDVGAILYNLGGATVGNIVGGAILVGFLYWAAFHKKAEAK